MAKPNVFVLDTHGRPGLVAIRNLGKHDLSVTAGSYQRWNVGGMSKHADRVVTTPNPVDQPDAFLDVVERELSARDYDMLLPINEWTVELIVRHRDRFESETNLPFGPYEQLRVGLDKGRTVETARELSLPHPRTMLPGEVDFDAVEEQLGLPVVVKPHRGSSRVGVSVCQNVADAESVYRQTTEERGATQLQEFIPMDDERGVYTFYNRRSQLAGVTVQRRLRSNPPEGGASTYRETVADPDLVERSDDLLSSLGWVGVAMLEFRVDARDGVEKLVDINPRLWGSLALSVFAGVEFPYLLYLLAVDDPIEPELEYDVGVRARCLFTDLVQVAKREDRLRALVQFFTPSTRPTCYDVVSIRDPKPTLGQMMYMVDLLAKRDRN